MRVEDGSVVELDISLVAPVVTRINEDPEGLFIVGAYDWQLRPHRSGICQVYAVAVPNVIKIRSFSCGFKNPLRIKVR